MLFNIILVLFLVGLNGFFVAAEFALVKLRQSEASSLAEEGNRSASVALGMLQHLDAYLSACQLGITLASLGLGWVGEPLVARMIEPLFIAIHIPVDKVDYLAFPVAFGAITFLHITLGEQAPKILAISRHKRTALMCAIPLSLFYQVFCPFIWFLNMSSNFILSWAGIKTQDNHGTSHTEEELRLILMESVAGGHVTGREQALMENVLNLEGKMARQFMLSRHEIVFLDQNDLLESNLKKIAESGHTRFPLCDGDLDHKIFGVVHVKDIFSIQHGDTTLSSLESIVHPCIIRDERMALDALLHDFQKEKKHLALLVDELGTVSGMITLENVLEELVGQIQDEFDKETPPIVEKSPNVFEMEGSCPLSIVQTHCGFKLQESQSDTIGGLVCEILGHIPKPEESITLPSCTITVTKAAPTRVVQVLVQKKID